MRRTDPLFDLELEDGVKRQFGLHFGVNGIIDKKYTRFFARLFNDRITGDYDDFIQYDELVLVRFYRTSTNFKSKNQRSLVSD